MTTISKCVLLLSVVGFIPVSTKSFHNCCQSLRKDLEKKSEASTLLCTANNKTFVPLPFHCKSFNNELQEKWDGYNKICPAIRGKECKYILILNQDRMHGLFGRQCSRQLQARQKKQQFKRLLTVFCQR
jgi:hypothetical protein